MEIQTHTKEKTERQTYKLKNRSTDAQRDRNRKPYTQTLKFEMLIHMREKTERQTKK